MCKASTWAFMTIKSCTWLVAWFEHYWVYDYISFEDDVIIHASICIKSLTLWPEWLAIELLQYCHYIMTAMHHKSAALQETAFKLSEWPQCSLGYYMKTSHAQELTSQHKTFFLRVYMQNSHNLYYISKTKKKTRWNNWVAFCVNLAPYGMKMYNTPLTLVA